MSAQEGSAPTLEYWRNHRKVMIRCHVRDSDNRRIERPTLTKVPPWLVAGVFIGHNLPGSTTLKVLAASSDLCIVEGNSEAWSIDTDIVVKHWHIVAEVSP